MRPLRTFSPHGMPMLVQQGEGQSWAAGPLPSSLNTRHKARVASMLAFCEGPALLPSLLGPPGCCLESGGLLQLLATCLFCLGMGSGSRRNCPMGSNFPVSLSARPGDFWPLLLTLEAGRCRFCGVLAQQFLPGKETRVSH